MKSGVGLVVKVLKKKEADVALRYKTQIE